MKPDQRTVMKVIHGLLNAKRYTDRTNLIEDIAKHCAKFFPGAYNKEMIHAALARIEHGKTRGREIPTVPIPGVPHEPTSRQRGFSRDAAYALLYGPGHKPPPELSRAEAADILGRVQRKLGVPGPRVIS